MFIGVRFHVPGCAASGSVNSPLRKHNRMNASLALPTEIEKSKLALQIPVAA